MSIRDRIRSFTSPSAVEVETPRLGTAYVRTPTAGEIERLFGGKRRGDALSNTRVFAMFAVDEEGERLFDPADKDDVATLASLPNEDVGVVVEKVLELAGIEARPAGK